MSDLPETSENPSTSSHETPQLTQETGIGPDNINKDHLEQEMDNQISNSIDDQEREEAELSQNADNHNIDNSNLENEVETTENNQNENQVNNNAESDVEENPGIFNRIFNRENLMRVFNQIIADPDIDQIFDEEMSENEDDDDLEEEDAGYYFNEGSEEEDLDDVNEESNNNQDNDETNQMEDYENAELPVDMNYDTALPSTHDYLGENFEEVSAPKTIHEQNDEVDIPLLPFPGSEIYWRYETNSNNDIQLLPGQIMPLFFYAPLQISMIKKRMKDKDPTIGFALTSKFFKQLIQQQQPNAAPINDQNSANDTKLGILAEIISARDESSNEDTSSMMHGTDGLVIKVKGRERFRILDVRREITGCMIATVKILPDIVLKKNPLNNFCARNTEYLYHSYLHKNQATNLTEDNRIVCTQSKIQLLSSSQPHMPWVFRNNDCDYTIHLIVKELIETFKQRLPFSVNSSGVVEGGSFDIRDPLIFSNWLLKNFPFNDQMRIDCLKLNCVNHRLIHMYKLLKSFTNISCQTCGIRFCSKTDVFSISKQGFMNAFLNPGGFVHETLTIYKLMNYRLSRDPPSTQHSWFPGYGWQILSCRNCTCHIGWKFTATSDKLTPQKFYGLTRKSVSHTYSNENEDEEDPTEEQQRHDETTSRTNSVMGQNE